MSRITLPGAEVHEAPTVGICRTADGLKVLISQELPREDRPRLRLLAAVQLDGADLDALKAATFADADRFGERF